MHATTQVIVSRSRLFKSLLAALFFTVTMTQAVAYYPNAPWGVPYNPGAGFGPAFNNPYPRAPGYFRGIPYAGNPWQRQFAYQRPWGKVNGGMTPDGTFWINIHFGGNYRDLQYLMSIMQMSGALQMNMDGQSHSPLDFSSRQDDLWPL